MNDCEKIFLTKSFNR